MKTLNKRPETLNIQECPEIPDTFFSHPEYGSRRFWIWEDYVGSYLEYYTDIKDVEWYSLGENRRGMTCVDQYSGKVYNYMYGA